MWYRIDYLSDPCSRWLWLIVDACVSDVLDICPLQINTLKCPFWEESLSSTQNVFSVRSAATLDFLFSTRFLSQQAAQLHLMLLCYSFVLPAHTI